MKKYSLTIGIPAFNEEANIAYLLRDLLKQKAENFVLKNIILISDGSNDNTVKIAKSVDDNRIKVIASNKRKGKAFRLNQFNKISNTDVLVIFDADTLIKDALFLNKIVSPIILGKADLTSVTVREIEPTSWIGKILKVSMDFKRNIFENYNRGNNFYTCHGRARAFSKNLYKTIKYDGDILKFWFCEDGYSYLFTVFNNFKYIFVKETAVYYKLPEKIEDHGKQSIRFYKTQKIFKKIFGEEFINEENYLTTTLILMHLVRYFFVNPLIVIYVFVAGVYKIKSLFSEYKLDIWSTPKSSKQLRKI